MKKRILSFALILCMMFSMLPAAKAEAASGLNLGWPVNDDYIIWSIDQYYGGGGPHYHGMDIGRTGSNPDIVAVADGEIMFGCTTCKGSHIRGECSCKEGSGWGNYVQVKHVINGVTYYAVYAHLDSVVKTSGTVKKGEKLGTMGNTGPSDGTHLHFCFWTGTSQHGTAKAWGYSNYDSCARTFDNYKDNYEVLSRLRIIQGGVERSEYYKSWIQERFELKSGYYYLKPGALGYISKCRSEIYPSSFTITVDETHDPLWSLPCSNQTDKESVKVGNTIAKGTKLKVTGVILNSVTSGDHYWYKAKNLSTGEEGWFYSNYTDPGSIVFDNTISVTGVDKPTSLSVGGRFWIKGDIKTSGCTMTKLTGYIYDGNKTSGASRDASDSGNGKWTSYSLYKSRVDDALDFNTLPAGYYTYVVKADIINYYVDSNNKLQSGAKTITLNDTKSYFKVGEPAGYTVTFDGNGGTASTGSIKVQSGKTIGTLPTATQDGYNFVGWYTSGGSKAESSTVINGNVTYYAKWERKTCTITYDANGGTVDPTKETLEYGEYLKNLPKAVREGYWFENWYTKPDGGNLVDTSTTMIFEDTTIYAHWSPKTYGLYLDKNDNSDVSITTPVTVTYGKPYGNLEPAVRENYEFEGWFTDPVGGTEVTSDMIVTTARDHTLYAHWRCEHEYSEEITAEASCTEPGIVKYTCVNCGVSYTEEIPATGHDYVGESVTGNCTDYAKTVYTCSNCGDSYEEYIEDGWTEWSTAYPTGIDAANIETKTEYRYSDYETTGSTETSLPGYELLGSEWVKSDSGSKKYVDSWPSGFNTSHNLYNTYSGTPVRSSESETEKIEVSSGTAGYIYYHWCRGTYTGGPINRLTNQSKTGTFNTFHAFFSTSSASNYDPSGNNGQASRYYPNGSVCKDSYWYYPITVTNQSWTEYTKQYTYGRWGEWSAWSEEVPAASATRQVEDRTLYRYFVPVRGEHSWDEGVVISEAACTEQGSKLYTCSLCGETKTESIPAAGHKYTATVVTPTCTEQGYTQHSCSVCDNSYKDTYIAPAEHSWDAGTVTIAPQEGVAGIKTYTCRVCGATKTEVIAALPKTYTVNYAGNGGYGVPNTQKKNEGESLTLSTTAPTKTGHSFLGWASSPASETAEYKPGDVYKGGKSVTLYAVWKANTYTISYNANGGSTAPETQEKTYNVPITLSSEIPARTGYDFLGWANSSSATAADYFAGSSYTVNGTATLYAVWARSSYALNFNANGGSVNSENKVVVYGNTYGELPIPTREGYTFDGWFTEAQSGDQATAETVVAETGDRTVYAHWTIKTYTVSYDANGGGSGIPSNQTKTHGIALTLSSSVPKRTGYVFNGWAISPDAKETQYQPGDKYSNDNFVYLYALWTPVSYQISFDANGGEGAPEVQTKTHGIAMTLNSTVPIRRNYAFLGWATSSTAEKPQYTAGAIYEGNANVTLYAVWEYSAETYTVSYDANGGDVTPETQTKTYGIPIYISNLVPEKEGTYFLGWATTPDAVSPEYLAGDEYAADTSVQLYAVWARLDTVLNSGKCGDDATWTMFDSGVLQIEGTGSTNSYTYTWNYPWFSYRDSVTAVIIKDGITELRGSSSLGHGPFDEYDNLKYVSLPDTLNIIGNNAFYGCKNLTSIHIPACVNNIGKYAFENCSRLNNVYIDSLESWNAAVVYGNPVKAGANVYINGELAVNLIIPSTITEIRDNAFENFTNIVSVTVPENVTSIGNYAFANCVALETVSLPNELKTIGSGAFTNCDGLSSIIIPESVTFVGNNVLSGCDALTTVSLTNGIQTIGDEAFSNCISLNSIYVPTSVNSIGKRFTVGCSTLEKITVSADNEVYASIGGVLYDKEITTLLTVPCNYPAEYISIPSTVISIGDYALAGCNALAGLTLPDSLLSIGEYAFSDCTQLKSISLPTDMTSIGNYAFYKCEELKSVTLPDEIVAIVEGTFKNCTQLVSIELPDSVRIIENSAFEQCRQLESIKLPSEMDSIGSRAFSGCITLSGEIVIPEGLTKIESNTFDFCKNVSNFVIPEGVSTIGASAFSGCQGIKEVTIPEGVVSIKSGAFSSCYSLKNVNLPSSLQTIEGYAFAYDNQIATVVLPENLEILQSSAFYHSWNTDNIVIPPKISSIAGVFRETQMDKLVLPISVTDISNAFASCKDIYYEGTETAWAAIAGVNPNLYTNIHYEYDGLTMWIRFEGENDTTYSNKKVARNAPYGELPTAEREGYTFFGWYTDLENGELITDETIVTALRTHTLYAHWTPNEYTVSFDANGGTDAPEAQKKFHDMELVLTDEIPAKKGYAFQGWAIEANTEDVTYQPGDIIKANEERTLYAVWTPAIYEISFNGNGVTASIDSVNISYGEVIGELPVIEREGYNFSGWYTATDGGVQITAETVAAFDDDCTLYAQWAANIYDVFYDANGGTGAPEAQSKEHDAVLELCDTVPQRPGYVFSGWAETAEAAEAEYSAAGEFTKNSNVTLYAVWTPAVYSINFDAGEGTVDTDSKQVVYAAAYGELPTAKREGYRFTGWAVAGQEARVITPESIVSIAEDHTLNALWETETYMVSFDPNGGSGGSSQTKQYGETIVLDGTEPARPGYTFVGWASDPEAAHAEYINGSTYYIEGNSTLYAVWQKNVYFISFNANGGNVGTSSKSVEFMDVYGTLPTPVRANYKFLGWFTAVDSGSRIYEDTVANITADQTLYAHWTPVSYITSFNACGGRASKAAISVNYGQVYGELPTAERIGYTFSGWFTAAEGGSRVTEETVVSTASNHMLYAQWTPAEYTVSYDANGGTGAPEAQIKVYDTELALSADIPTREGYIFVGWATDPDADHAEYGPEGIYYFNADAVLYAMWAEASTSTLAITAQPQDMAGIVNEEVHFSVTAVGDGLSYQWQISSDDGEIWRNTEFKGAKTDTLYVEIKNYRVGNLYRCIITDSAGNSLTSEEVRLSLLDCEATITSQPENYAGSVGDVAEFTVGAVGEDLKYQWYYSKNYGVSWGESSSTGSNTPTLTLTLSKANSGRMYRCVITDKNGQSITSSEVQLRILSSEIEIMEQPQDYFGEEYSLANFTVNAEGENLSYQWYVQKGDESEWVKTENAGFDTDTLEVRLYSYRNGWKYKCCVTSGDGITVFTDEATLLLANSEIIIEQHPESYTGRVNDLTEFTVVATGENLTYQWMFSKDGGETWEQSYNEGYDTATLKVRLYEYRDGYQYMCLITSGQTWSIATDVVTINKIPTTVKIKQQPQNMSCAIGDTAQFTVGATGDGLVYKWQYSNDAGQTWADSGMTGANTDTISVQGYEYRDGQWYRCKVFDESGSYEISTAATLRVGTLPVITKQPESYLGQVDGKAVFAVEAEGQELTYQWYFRNSSGGGWAESGAADAKTNTMIVDAKAYRDGYSYRCEITNSAGLSVYSEIVTLTIAAESEILQDVPEQDNENELVEDILPENIVVCKNDTIDWTLNEQGVLHITGAGRMDDYSESEPAPWCEKAEQIKEIVIDEGITSIGEMAFAGCYNAEKLTLPSTVSAIASKAFDGCKKLIAIEIPASTVEIASDAFPLETVIGVKDESSKSESVTEEESVNEEPTLELEPESNCEVTIGDSEESGNPENADKVIETDLTAENDENQISS